MKLAFLVVPTLLALSLYADPHTPPPLRDLPVALAPGLIKAAAAGDLDEVKREYVDPKRIDVTDPDGTSALMWAAYKGYADVVDFLLEKGADYNKGDNEGNRPLAFAAAGNQLVIANKLLDKGALLDYHNRKQLTASDLAKSYGYETMVTLLKERRQRAQGAPTAKPSIKIYPDVERGNSRFQILIANTEDDACLELQQLRVKPKNVTRSLKICQFIDDKQTRPLKNAQDVDYQNPTWRKGHFHVGLIYVPATPNAPTMKFDCELNPSAKTPGLNCLRKD